ncbi:MAG: DUF58 domain-containing protein [Chlamydiales bacterium]
MDEKTKELFAKIHRIEITTTQLVEDLFAGAYRSVFKGRGLEFEDVRPFQTGDDVRTVDWNVTARYGYPFVKTFTEERQLTVMLLVDRSASLRFGSVNQSKQDLVAEVSALLGFSAIKNHDRVGLILFTDRVELYIPPKNGTRHLLRIIEEILTFKPAGKGTDIKEALSFLSKVQTKAAICFLLSDFIVTGKFEREMKIASKRHDCIAVSIHDPLERHIPDVGLVSVQDLESDQKTVVDFSDIHTQETFRRQVEKRRMKTFSLMKRVKAGYVELETGQPYNIAIKNYFAMREANKWR